MPSFDDLARYMDKAAKTIPVWANDIARDVTIAILRDLTEVTPLDTSEAVTNWQVSLDSPNADEILVNLRKGRVIQGVWTHLTDPLIAASLARDAFATGKQVVMQKRSGQIIFIANNSDHILELNDGSSQQAPGGFVDRAVLLGEQVAMSKTSSLGLQVRLGKI